MGHLPKDLAEEFKLTDSDKDPGDLWVSPIYSTIQNQQHRLEDKIRDGSMAIGQVCNTMIDASLRGADVDAVRALSADPVAFEGWHITQRFDRQAAVNKKVRDHYRKKCGRDLPLAEMDMSSPELIAVASELGIPIGEDGRVQRSDNDPDSRSGHKSGTPKRSERRYIGFEGHKFVATRTHIYDPKTDTVTLGPKVPPYVMASHLSKANENVGPIFADMLPHALKRAPNTEHILADGGVTQNWESFNTKVIELGLQLHRTFDADHVHGGGDIVKIVVGKKKQKTHTVIAHCGELFHVNTPKHLLTPPPNTSCSTRRNPKRARPPPNAKPERNATSSEPR